MRGLSSPDHSSRLPCDGCVSLSAAIATNRALRWSKSRLLCPDALACSAAALSRLQQLESKVNEKICSLKSVRKLILLTFGDISQVTDHYCNVTFGITICFDELDKFRLVESENLVDGNFWSHGPGCFCVWYLGPVA